MPERSAGNSLFLINFATGISDGLVLPFAACMVAVPFLNAHPARLPLVGLLVATAGAIVYGLARFLGEKEEISHNHPQLAAAEAERESEQMNAVGIDRELTAEMQLQMEQERAQWLREVQDNDMGWQQYSTRRAVRGGLQTALGFLLGGLLVIAPFALQYDWLYSLSMPCVLFLVLTFAFGWWKGLLTGQSPARSALRKAARGGMLLLLLLIALAFAGYRPDRITDDDEVPPKAILP